MKRNQQLNLFKKNLRFHGGSLLLGRRKSIRPLTTKDAIHTVLRSSWAYAGNSFLLLKNKKDIERILFTTSRKYQIKIYRFAIVSNHLHLIIRISSRKNYQTFIRVLSGLIASHVMKMQSFKIFKKSLQENAESVAGDPLKSKQIQYEKALAELQGKGQAFWQFRPFTRILHWGRDFKNSCHYLLMNNLEATGFISYTKRKSYSNYKQQNKSKKRTQARAPY